MASPATTQGTGAPLVSLVTTAETAALVSNAFAYNAPGGQGVQVSAVVTGATGASTTSVQIRLYRGGAITGTQIGPTFQQSAAASSFYSADVQWLDTAPAASGQYTVSVQQVAASGNGTVTGANISLEAANATGA